MSQQELNQANAALQRITELRTKVAGVTHTVETLLNLALQDSANFNNAKISGALDRTFPTPNILSRDNLIELAVVKNKLTELNNYYDQQYAQFTAVIALGRQQQELMAMPTPAPTPVPQPTPAQAEVLLANLRASIEQAAAGGTPAPVEGSGANAAVNVTSTATTAGGLPAEEPIVETPQGRSLPTPPAPTNNLERLLSQTESPLVQIFAPGPWLPEGKGTVTVGTFQWYKETNPAVKSAIECAKLPTGFYGNEHGRPACVILRMENAIVYWNFGFTADDISVFMVGLSNANPSNVRWFKVGELSASYTLRLVTELQAVLEKYKSK